MRNYGVDASADVYNRHDRVLELAREIMLAQMANPEITEFNFDSVVSLAESWIESEDAYVLPEDMQ